MIVRELLVKLGFDIDSAKLNKFNASIDATKKKMQGIRNSSAQGIASIAGGKLANAIPSETQKRFLDLKNYNDELASLSKSERAEVLALNRMENQAIKETTRVEKTELKERQKLVREQFREKQSLQNLEQRNYKKNFVTMSSVGRKFAILGASITAGFGLSLRSTLRDAANFKLGKGSSVFDKSQISTVDAFSKALNSTKSIVASLRNSFVIDMLPAIKETLEVFNAWVQKNKVLIKEKLKDIVVGLAGAFNILSSVIGQVVSVLDFIISKTIGWRTIITAVISLGAAAWFISVASSIIVAARAFKVLSLAILTNPLAGTIAAITAGLALLVNEIYVTIQGGDSLISRFLESDAWKFCQMGIDSVVDSLKDMWQWLKKVTDGIFNFPSNVTTEIKGFLNIGKNKFDNFFNDDPSEQVKNKSKNFSSNDSSKLRQNNVKKFEMLDNFFNDDSAKQVKNKFDNFFNDDSGKLGQGNVKKFEMPAYTPEEVSKVFNSNVTNNARSSNVTQRNSFNMSITVPTGTTQEQAIDIANIVKGEIEKHQTFQNEKIFTAIGSY